MPRPHRAERVEKAYILEQVRIEPETGRYREHGDDEKYKSHNGHGKEETNQS